jgi:hypothetical protein
VKSKAVCVGDPTFTSLQFLKLGKHEEYTDSEENLLNCQIKDELVNQLIALNNKLNLLSPDVVRSDEERTEVEQQRESLYADIKRHRSKGHDGKPCPAVRYSGVDRR